MSRLPTNAFHFYRLAGNPDHIEFTDEVGVAAVLHHDSETQQHLRDVSARSHARGIPITLGRRGTASVLALHLPAGAGTRTLFVDETTVDAVQRIAFEDYRYLEAYQGFWASSPGAESVEVRVRYADPSGLLKHTYEQAWSRGVAIDQLAPIDITSQGGGTLRFGQGSPEAAVLLGLEDEPQPSLTLRIAGGQIASDTDAHEAVERIGGSFLLDVDSAFTGAPWFEEVDHTDRPTYLSIGGLPSLRLRASPTLRRSSGLRLFASICTRAGCRGRSRFCGFLRSIR